MAATLKSRIQRMARRGLEESRLPNTETRAFGVGPLDFDCAAARRQGWTEKQIRRAADALAKLSKKEHAIARRAHPELWRDEDGITVFVGPDERCGCGHEGHLGKCGRFRQDSGDYCQCEWKPAEAKRGSSR